MNTKRNYGLYAVAAAIVLVGALALGIPLAALAWIVIIAVCPLMMFFMLRGMRADNGGHDMQDVDRTHDRHARPGRK
ncbi:DUF2933 domain-containing protein [Streptomyces sp. ISL-44]|uniref:DUF2933 domain-containing protein n=1 Tax=Streptomyces sp. ISL-44 TaxID=2819184 RepID=UPI001BEA61F8|nr:DUF2933 domain-containing protein [Streptomyces sp. ISL-44]MBT2541788.1 DUF2933 domain-containing protein [Streptomyces sp. ISL-44]